MLTTERLIESFINFFFSKPLPQAQHDLAARIFLKIGLEEDLSFEELELRVTQLEREFTDIPEGRFAYLFLQKIAGDITEKHFDKNDKNIIYLNKSIEQAKIWLAEGDASIRMVTLLLYYQLGITQRELGQVAESIKTYEQGLEYAQNWLDDSSVWEKVLGLYYNLGTSQEKLGQVAKSIKTYERGLEYAQNWLDDASVWKQVLLLYGNYSVTLYNVNQPLLFLSPYNNFWAWAILQRNLGFLENFDNILYSLKQHSKNSPPPAEFTTVFQAFLHTFLTKWHNPDKSRRIQITTENLLKISETLYLIEQIEENQRLQTIYNNLQTLTEFDGITELLDLQTKISNSKEDLTGFQNLSGLPYLLVIPQKFITKYRLKNDQIASQELNVSIQEEPEFKQQIKRTKTSLINWLTNNIQQTYPTEGLESLSAIILGMLFASRCTTNNPVTILAEWQQNQPWNSPNSIDFLQTTFSSATNWQQWITKDPDRPNKPLSSWNITKRIQHLNIQWSIHNKPQPKIQNWLRELDSGDATNLIRKLQFAWQQADDQAKSLTNILTKFNNHENDLTALQAIILGQAPKLLTDTIQNWLFPQKNETDVLTTIDNFKQSLTRAASIYQPTHPPLADIVHNWTKVLISESKPDRSSIPVRFEVILWQLLERSRIALIGQSKKLPENWQDDVGKKLWQELQHCITQIEHGYNTDDKPWPLFEVWLKYFKDKLPETHTWQKCQKKLQPREALLQPFFEQDQLRVLWLDQNGLQLRELPEFTVNIASWNQAIDTLSKKSEALINGEFEQAIQAMKAVMAELKPFAKILSEWANELKQITVIFPAPLGQLPWETLPELENILVRAISLDTWLQKSKPKCRTNLIKKPWIVCDPNADDTCTVKEANWLAQHFDTKVDNPSHFDALQKFHDYQHIHLTTHGKYDSDNPTASRLSLNYDMELPIWMLNAIKINADLIILSACESNLTGDKTKELLKPIGIGPNLIAAGAKTVVGTLWAYDGFAALCFSYYFYQISEQNPAMPWHIVTAQARNAVRKMTHTDLEFIINEFNLKNQGEPCWDKVVEAFYAESHNKNNAGCISKPFTQFNYWAGFIALGQPYRNSGSPK